MEELKRRIDNTKTELDMAAEEQLINDLLDYAECNKFIRNRISDFAFFL